MVFSAIIEQKVGDTDIFHYICRAYMNKLPYHKMKKYLLTLLALPALAVSAQNPFLPLWEFIPDGEPYVFEDPDRPGEYRMYVYGSHDSTIDKYCGYEQVVWSAPVNDLTNWRYDGVTLKVTHDRDGKQLHEDGRGDMLYAPDVTVRTERDGSKTYYLYPNNQEGGRQGMVAKSKRPDGPYEVINWSKENPRECVGDLRFDPGVFIDDDGKVYGYWGFEQSFGAELDPVTMATIKPETLVTDLVANYNQDDTYRFFEASSMRKIEDKYVFIYSRWTRDGEFGLPTTNYTLAYAYGDNPLGPFTYGGTIIDGRGRKTLADGTTIATATSGGNTHGSIVEVNGQWYVVYHRQTGKDEYSRQAMAAPITVQVEKGKGGKVTISEGEYTSEGFNIDGLNPLQRTAAGWACYYTGPQQAANQWPNFIYYGSYVQPTRIPQTSMQWPFSLKTPVCPVVNNTAGSVVGYKYFNFSNMGDAGTLTLHYKPQGVDGIIKVMLGAPTEQEGGRMIGQLMLNGRFPQREMEMSIPVMHLQGKGGKQALYFVFESLTKGKSLCELYDFIFKPQDAAKAANIHTITVGKTSMQIDAAQGGRIISYTYDNQEVLSHISFPNMFGSTFWTSPQKEWNWPPVREHDVMPYTVEKKDGALVMTSQLSEKFPIRIKKSFVTDATDDAIVITYTMTNEGKEARTVAPWEISRVQSEGNIFFDAPIKGITPAGLMPFKQKNGLAWYEIDNVDRQRKINADGKGWLAYEHNGLLLIKHFADLKPADPAPDEAEIQVYVHDGHAYVELESQGKYTTLQPGESMDWTVRWNLRAVAPGEKYWKIK